MGSGRGKMRMNVEVDRLSSLPDELIHKILSFMDTREAIGTSQLSSRWRFIWKSMPYLKFSSDDFSTLPKFSKFITNVLSRRDNLSNVYSLYLRIRVKTSFALAKRILNYAFSHNIQEMDVVCLLENDIEFPLPLFSSQPLKHLSLILIKDGHPYKYPMINICLTSTCELPTLTTLGLHDVTLCDGYADGSISVLSKCPNLKNLVLNKFETTNARELSIFHPRLSNLTLKNYGSSGMVINVAAPQLKNLTINMCYTTDFKISAPDLVSLIYNGCDPLHLTTEGFHCLEKADICVYSSQDSHANEIICLFRQLHSVKFLKLNGKIIEILSSSMDLILQQPSPFLNLKSLRICPKTIHLSDIPNKVAMSTGLKSYLLGSSPGATFTMALAEEFEAQKLMIELRVLLDDERHHLKTNRARLERRKTAVESHEPNELEIGGSMAQIKSCLQNLGILLQLRKEKACLIISKLQCIEEVLESLPASIRAEIQPYFSSLRAEANTVISKIIDCMKTHCDESQSHTSVLFCEPATTLEPPS